MELYKKYEALCPIYQGGLTNHLPMVLTALKKLGLDDNLIREKLDDYCDEKGLYDLSDSNYPTDSFNQNYINRTGFYLGELNRKGEDIVIGEFINISKYMISSALFHGLIRVAYAKQESHPLMIAQALAYFEITSEKIEINTRYINAEEFIKNHNRFVEIFEKLNFSVNTGTTMEKFKELLNLKVVSDNLVFLRNPQKDFILDFIFSCYQRTKDYYILHLITGFEALLELEEYIFDFDNVLNHFFAVAQVFILFNPRKNIEEDIPQKSFEQLKKETAELIDFHDIKLFYSLLKLDRLFENKKALSIANQIFKE